MRSLGNKKANDYILAETCVGSLCDRYQSDSDSMPMNRTNAPNFLEDLFESIVLALLNRSTADDSHSESVPTNQFKPGLFKKAKEEELKEVQEELSSPKRIALN